MRKFLLKPLLFCLVLSAAVSCDKDFNEIGTNIVGDDHFTGDKFEASVKAYTQETGAVQTNKVSSNSLNIPINALGYYNNPAFGSTTASFVTQLEMDSPDPTFNPNPVVTGVTLTVPYFSTLTATDDDGNHTYELDSILGTNKIRLDVYASNYYLRDLDPATGFQSQQRYYSDQSQLFDDNIDPSHPSRLNDSDDASQNDAFFFDPAEIVTYKTDDTGLQTVDTRTAPEMNLKLNKDFFQQKIFGSGAVLSNNADFKNYLRGLYFKVSPTAGSPDQGSLAQLNFKQGKITITYECDTSSSDPTRIEKTFVLNLAGNTVNLLQNQFSTLYSNGLAAADPANGDERLYLKGGAGSMAVIDLFGPDADGNGVADELEAIRNQEWLINDANLSFYIDRDQMGTAPEPGRIYLYDLTNHQPLIDYSRDVTTNAANPKGSKYIYGGILEKDDDEHGVRYRIRLTDHIRNLVRSDIDSTNVRLGLVVTETIGNATNAYLESPVSGIDRIPAASVASPLGTILYGSNSAVIDAKRLKFTIYYTKKSE